MKTNLAVLVLLLCQEYSPVVAMAQNAADAPAVDETRQITGKDLPALMVKHRPPSFARRQGVDPEITFDSVDVVVEKGVFGPRQTPYLSIGRDGRYFYKTHTLQLPGGNNQVGAAFVGHIPAKRMTELQRLLKETNWLTAAGGEGRALHTDASDMVFALTRDGQTKTVIFQGSRPAPYADLQKFIYDLLWQEQMYYRLTRTSDERKMAVFELRNAVECALGRPGLSKPTRYVDFERYYELFANTLDRWSSSQTEELRAAIDLMMLLERKEHANDIARLRNDRDSNLRTTVAQALPALAGEKAIPWLVEMLKSTQEARIALVRLGEPAVPVIAEIIENDKSRDGQSSIVMIRAYIDHWKELPQPIDQRITDAVLANMQIEVRRNYLNYQREFLKLAGVAEPKPATLNETVKLFFQHLKSGDEKALDKIKDNVGSMQEWLKLREKLDPAAELNIDTLLVDKASALVLTKSLRDTTGNEIQIVVFLNLTRGTDWRVGPAIIRPAGETRQKDQFLKSHPDANAQNNG